MNVLEAQANTTELTVFDASERLAGSDVPLLSSPSSTLPDNDMPPGTAGRAAALGL